MLLSSKENSCDNPTYHQAVNGSDMHSYLKVADSEFDMLDKTIKAWDIVKQTKEMNILPST